MTDKIKEFGGNPDDVCDVCDSFVEGLAFTGKKWNGRIWV